MPTGSREYPLSNYRVLVVEDNPSSRRLIVDVVKSMGIRQIYKAEDGLQAWAFFEDGVLFDLVICDWMMPNMSGLDVLKQLRASHLDVPFIMITAKADDKDLLRAKRNGVNAIVRKPFQPVELIEAVQNLSKQIQAHAAITVPLQDSDAWEI